MSMVIKERLKRSELFSPLSPGQWEQLRPGIAIQEVAKNGILFSQGQPFTHLYFLDEGIFKLGLEMAEGGEKIVHIVKAGETFATALMFLDRKTYPVTAQAIKESTIIGVDAVLFRKILTSSPELCMTLLGDLSQRLSMHLGNINSNCLRNAQSRVARYLLEELPHDPYGHHMIQLEISKQILASLLSITPETLSRSLGDFEKKKIIFMQNRQIQILDLKALKNVAGLCTNGVEHPRRKTEKDKALFV
ncbi:MAG: Crp/Fnr family transcriptional regulator [Nitrospirae bacterium]|nr:Crp/Fnr family transcriptional regulator [Magnetococcales bacterium]